MQLGDVKFDVANDDEGDNRLDDDSDVYAMTSTRCSSG